MRDRFVRLRSKHCLFVFSCSNIALVLLVGFRPLFECFEIFSFLLLIFLAPVHFVLDKDVDEGLPCRSFHCAGWSNNCTRQADGFFPFLVLCFRVNENTTPDCSGKSNQRTYSGEVERNSHAFGYIFHPRLNTLRKKCFLKLLYLSKPGINGFWISPFLFLRLNI